MGACPPVSRRMFSRNHCQAPLCMQDFYHPSSSRPWLEKAETRHGTQKAQRQEGEEEEEKEEVEQINGCTRGLPIFGFGCRPSLPSLDDLACILHECRKERDQEHAICAYTSMCKSGLDTIKSLGNLLVSHLVEIGNIQDAKQLSKRLMFLNEQGGNSLIMGFLECGRLEDAFILHKKMQKDDHVHPSVHTFVALLKACAKMKDLGKGVQIHDDVARLGLLQEDLFVCSTLVDMYMKCGALAKAQKVFDEAPHRNVVLWNVLIAGYVENRHSEEALYCYKQMLHQRLFPNAVTFVC
eukprot:c25297_g3_i1 orf=1-885(-)